MEIKPLFTINFFAFKCEKSLLEDTTKKIELLNWRPGMKNEVSGDLHRSKDFAELHAWFQSCVNEVKHNLNLPFNELPIIQSWSNRSFKGMWHHGHVHELSFLSGIFYLNSSSSGKTWFSTENPWFNFPLIYFKHRESNILIHKEVPEAGKLVLFPSHIYHSVDDWEDNIPRYSVAFNTFPQGSFGRADEKCTLNIKIDTDSNNYEELF